MSIHVFIMTVLLAIGPFANGQGDFSMFTLNERDYWVYTPSTYNANTAVPLVVALHGCSQSATIFAVDTELNDYAEERNFIVVYPEQPTSSNSSNCWNWFLPEHQYRETGEPQLNAAIINAVIADKNIATDRIFALGMSAGAAEANIMAATYPDLFAAISSSAGLEYMGGATAVEAVGSQVSGIAPDPDVQGERAYTEMQKSTPRRTPVIAFHGSMDATVQPNNSEAIIQQWAQTNDLVLDDTDNDLIDGVVDRTETAQVPDGRTFTRTIYEDENGDILMEKYIIDGMTHRYSGGPENAPGGSIYTDPTGPKATEISLDFFGITQNDALAVSPDFTFSVQEKVKALELNWQVNNFSFGRVQIQRAMVANDFFTIGTATVQDGSIQFLDTTLPVTTELFYRLSWQTPAGIWQFSPVVRVTRTNETTVQIFPNPAYATTKIHYTLSKEQTVKLYLVNTLGQTVWQITEQQTAGQQQINLPLTNMAKGNYWVILQTQTNKITHKIQVY